MKNVKNITCMLLFIFIITGITFASLPKSTASGTFAVKPLQVFTYLAQTDAPMTYNFSRLELVITIVNSTGVFANVSMTNRTGGIQDLINEQVGWDVESLQSYEYEACLDRLSGLEFLFFPKESWREIQQFILSSSNYSPFNRLAKIQDEFTPYLGAIRWIKSFELNVIDDFIDYGSHYQEYNVSYCKLEFDYTGILIKLTKHVKYYNNTSGYGIPVSPDERHLLYEDAVTYELVSTTADLSIAVPPSTIYLIAIGGIVGTVIFLILRKNRVKPRKKITKE